MVVSSSIAYGFIPNFSCGDGADGKPLPACSNVAPGQACCTKASNMGWRYLLFTQGALCLVIFFLRFVVFRFQESPKFLLHQGRDQKAVDVMHHIARFNARKSGISMEVFAALGEETSSVNTEVLESATGSKQSKSSFRHHVKVEISRYRTMFATPAMARLTILIWITYMFDYWGFSIAGKGSLADVTLDWVVTHDERQDLCCPKFCSKKTAPSTCRCRRRIETLSLSTCVGFPESSSGLPCTGYPLSVGNGLWWCPQPSWAFPCSFSPPSIRRHPTPR